MRILLSHTDIDGFGVNVLERLYHDYLGFDLILNKNYGFENESSVKELITPDNELMITDLSIPEDVFIEWRKVLKSLIIIDHHETSFYLDKYPGNVWSTDYCGTALFWIHVVKKKLVECGQIWDKKVDYFVSLVDTYDRWVDTSDLWLDATRLNKVCTGLGTYPFVDHMVKKLNAPWEWTPEEADCFEMIENSENLILADVEKDLELRKDNSGHTYVYIRIDEKSRLSMVCSKLMKNHPEIDYCICYGGSRTSFSLRTCKDLDLTRIHGVMGHKQAAGAKFTKKEFYDLLMNNNRCLEWVKDGQRKLDHISIGDADSDASWGFLF
jgi:oligoribonuclease NrnB/cAMP/cGMP phosphodiesterase (DHH superfamily)